MQEVASEAKKGPNEVQGGADLNPQKMNRQENSQGASTVKEEAERALKKLTRQD